jgi:Fic family protein
VKVQARRRGRGTYFYLVHSYREDGKVRKIEKYLGRRMPSDLRRFERDLKGEILGRTWVPRLDRIGAEYREERARMPESAREKELTSFAVQFTYDTNRIEGSSLTLRETSDLLERGVTPSERPMADVTETIAHQRVFLAELKREASFDLPTLLRWHRDLFQETKPDIAGQVRTTGVRISGSKFIPPSPIELDFLLQDYFRWFRRVMNSIHPVVLASQVHLKLVTIHPFSDGNGRTSRLAMNLVLHRKGFPMLDIPYERRSGYYDALEASQVGENETPFLRWFLRRYLDAKTRDLVPRGTKSTDSRTRTKLRFLD